MTLDSLLAELARLIAERLELPSQAPTPSRLLSVTEAATYLGRSKHAVYRLIGAGKLRAVRLDRHVALDRRDLDALIELAKH